MMHAEKLAGMEIDVQGLAPEAAVELLIEHSANMAVSDLFFWTQEDHVAVLVRHLGILQPLTILPLEAGRRFMAHIKAVAGMDVAERRRPMDGRWIHERDKGGWLDLRINTIPTLYGEDVSLRLLDRDSRMLALNELGLLRRDHNHLINQLNSPSGLILVTGPTGSGKTTSLYACLAYLNNGRRKINTIEDPIEYAVDGIRQSQVNPKLDAGFPELLRSVLRQAPDVIMIGEIRDSVTAATAVRAANSGHLVLATLHAPTAAGAIQSMLSLDVHPHFLSSCLLGAIAQRLVRTLCPHCKMSFDVSSAPHTFEDVRPWLEPGEGQHLWGPGGCSKCYHVGYAGRTGVFEMLPVSRNIRRMIADKEPTQPIRAMALREGTIEFKQSALLKVAQGQTSIEEVMRAIPTEYLGLED
jgi:type II secretory ATPase GspE/PulE/Tfp pilus assembly ATPase PilB-like protein